jgi:hypothetical protein
MAKNGTSAKWQNAERVQVEKDMIRNRGHSSQHTANRRPARDADDGTNGSKSSSSSLTTQRNFFVMLSVFLLGCLLFSVMLSPLNFIQSNLRDTGKCAVKMGDFRGHRYFSKESGTVGTKCLVENKFLRVSQHSVKFPGSDTIIDDWLWIDYHDRINVLVEDETKPDEERQFLVFEQSKYALEGRSSLAIIGGIIEPGEEPEAAARREVEEEMNMKCVDFHFLGR